MRNLKKFLALVLTVMMVMGLMVTANAVNIPTKDGATVTAGYGTAVDVLYALGVLKGDGDGIYDPKGPITRGEYATMLYRIGTGDVTNAKAADWEKYNEFTDVPNGEWYSGPVGYALKNGLMNGRDVGVFALWENISGYEALTGMLRVLGYDQNGELSGSNWNENAVYGWAVEPTINLVTPLSVSRADLRLDATRELIAQMTFTTIQRGPVWYNPVANGGEGEYQADGNEPLGKAVFGMILDADADDLDELEDLEDNIKLPDAFGRPIAENVVVANGKIVSGERPAADKIFSTKMDAGKAIEALDDLGIEKFAGGAKYIQNGFSVTGTNTVIDGADLDVAFGAGSPWNTKKVLDVITSSNNTVVEIYLNEKNEISTIVAINTFAVVLQAGNLDEVNDKDVLQLPDINGTDLEDYENTEGYEEGDVLLYTYGVVDGDNVIQELYQINPITVKVSEITTGTSLKDANGVTYPFSNANTGTVIHATANNNFTDDIDLYLDDNGNLVYATKHVDAEDTGDTDTAELAFVLEFRAETPAAPADPGTGSTSDNPFDGDDDVTPSSDGNPTLWAKLLLLNGTTITVKTTIDDIKTNADTTYLGKFVVCSESSAEAGAYVLSTDLTALNEDYVADAGTSGKELKIEHGKSTITYNGAQTTLYASSATVFLVATENAQDSSKVDYKAYVGSSKVPGLVSANYDSGSTGSESASANVVTAAVYGADDIAVVIYVDATTAEAARGSSADPAGVVIDTTGLDSDGTTPPAWYYVVAKPDAPITNNADGTYRTLTVIDSNGVMSEMKFNNALFSSVLEDAVKDTGAKNVLISADTTGGSPEFVKNSKGIVTTATKLGGSHSDLDIVGTAGTIEPGKNGLIKIDSSILDYDKDCVVYVTAADGTATKATVEGFTKAESKFVVYLSDATPVVILIIISAVDTIDT